MVRDLPDSLLRLGHTASKDRLAATFCDIADLEGSVTSLVSVPRFELKTARAPNLKVATTVKRFLNRLALRNRASR
jgi:hypothetical protein